MGSQRLVKKLSFELLSWRLRIGRGTSWYQACMLRMSADSCKPDRFTYNILIHGVCMVGVVDEALRLVKQMEALGYMRNVFTYTILIDGFCNAKRVDEAIRVLDTMKARNVAPTEATIRSLVHGAFRTMPPQEAFEMVLQYIEKEALVGRLTCDTLLCCLSDNCMAREAGALLRKLGERGFFPDSSTFNITMTCLVKGLALNETCGILDSFTERGIKLGFGTYILLIEALYKAGIITEGDRYLKQMVKGGPVSNVLTFFSLFYLASRIRAYYNNQHQDRRRQIKEMSNNSNLNDKIINVYNVIEYK